MSPLQLVMKYKTPSGRRMETFSPRNLLFVLLYMTMHHRMKSLASKETRLKLLCMMNRGRI